jgi:hypothetical protein
MVIKIEESMNHQITLCWEHIVENTKTTERGGGESVVYKLKQFYTY